MLADAAREPASSLAEMTRLRMQIVGDAGLALLALFVNVALSVFKPWGATPYGRRKQERHVVMAGGLPTHGAARVETRSRSTSRPPRWAYVVGLHAIGLVLLVLVVHLAGGGMRGH